MNPWSTWCLILAVGFSDRLPAAAVDSQPDPARFGLGDDKTKLDDEAKNRDRLAQILQTWETASQQIKTLHVVFERIDRSLQWGDQFYQGQALFKGPDRACFELIKPSTGPNRTNVIDPKSAEIKLAQEPTQRIVFTGNEVVQSEWEEKSIFRYPNGGKTSWFHPAKTLAGFPYLYQVKAAQLRERFDIRLLREDDKKVLLEFAPRTKIDQLSFSRAWIWLDKTTTAPIKVVVSPVAGGSRQEFRFQKITTNPELHDDYFRATDAPPGWKVNPGGFLR